MRCSFVFTNYERPCGNVPHEGRRLPLPNGDQVEFLLCFSHSMAFDAIMAAEKRRQQVIAEPPGTGD